MMAPEAGRRSKRFWIGIDVGGTFTDAVVVDAQGACVDAFKLLSTPDEPAQAVLEALERISRAVDLREAAVCHGTTVGTNTLIEHKGRRTALVTTAGFEDVIELRRQARCELYSFDQRISEPLVPAADRFGIAERLAFDGSVVMPIGDLRSLADRLAAAGFESVAICLFNAYASGVHEMAVEAALRAALPGAFICRSSDVAPEIREFERSSTTVVNAYIGPVVGDYVKQLAQGAAAMGIEALYVVKSSGGLTSPENAARYPVHLVESGPAAGIIAAAQFGAALGRKDVLAFDMGGTTAKAGVILRGEPRIASEFYADALVEGRPAGGYPILSPVVDLLEIGAGGGSIAAIDEAGVLKVGPRSAGARPGPACYGLGGELPTVTDAHAVIGTLRADGLSASGIELRRELAERAIEEHIARPKGWSIARAAYAILDIAVANMAAMVRVATVRRGLDPRGFCLVPSGGAGPLHAVAIARDVGIPQIAIPAIPGMFSALGATLSQVRHDVSCSIMKLARDLDAQALASAFLPLLDKINGLFAVESVSSQDIELTRHADVRFRGQLFELKVPLGPVAEAPPAGDWIEREFRRIYRAEYGFDLPDAEPEVVNLRVVGLGAPFVGSYGGRAASGAQAGGSGARCLAPILERDGSTRDVPVLDLAQSPATEIAGPALLQSSGATIWLPAGAHATVAEDRSVLISVAPDPGKE
ncbi:MAG: hydantoinase/oxoprolinase family protein [Proteobacteria bacterium]|nr:hydantoinase/oxoprolinase family protein [Pseudomonadota bacterium]